MLKKLLALALTLIMTLSLVTSCDFLNKVTGETETTATSDVTTAPVNDTITIADNGTVNYRVVRGEDASDAAIDAAQSIYATLVKLTGGKAEISTDWKKPTEEYNNDTYEILVGVTDYPQTTDIFKGLDYGSYIVKAVGNKIVVGGFIDAGTTVAAKLFTNKLEQTVDEAKSIILKAEEIETVGTANKTIADIPKLGGGAIKSVYDCGDSSTMVIFGSTTPEIFNSYKTVLTGAGYKPYTENAINSNLFATYVSGDDKQQMNLIYSAYNKETRLIIEPISINTLAGLESENVYTKICEPQITMAGLEKGSTLNAEGNMSYQNGMCFIIRLEDGRFIIEDGGFNRAQDAARILKILKEQNVITGKPVVAAWVISHAHGDHMGALRYFAGTYASQIIVEKFILNMPAQSQADLIGEGQRVNVEGAMAKFPNATIIKAHPGQVFYIANAKLTTLYTLEMYAPKDLSYYNTCTCVIQMEFNGYKIMMLGDVSEDGNAIMCKMYNKEVLKSDIVQVAHHGYAGGSTALYSLIDPTYVLWPMGLYDYDTRNYKGNARSEYLQTSKNVKRIFVAGKSLYTLPIPYTGTGETIVAEQ